jgi:hypothetical protein
MVKHYFCLFQPCVRHDSGNDGRRHESGAPSVAADQSGPVLSVIQITVLN